MPPFENPEFHVNPIAVAVVSAEMIAGESGASGYVNITAPFPVRD